MKTTLYSAVTLVTCAMLATSCAKDIETDTNIDPIGSAISFSPSVGHSTRATETDITNLGDFAVVARGMHPDGVLYDSYLIGNKEEGGEVAKYSSLTTEGTSGTWKLDRNVYWPTSLNRVLFIGYTTLKRNKVNNTSEDSKNGVLGSATFSVSTGDKPTISGFEPLKADLTTSDTENNGIWADGEGQKDLLVAFKQQDRGTQTTVNLNFRHALTQVSITAGQKDLDETADHRIVKVKGAWIVNAAQSGTLTADISVDPQSKEASNKTSWTPTGTETYGSYYNDMIPLKKDGTDKLLRHSLMLIPQDLTAWDGTSETTTGAYIMLLCRIELKHKGAKHDENTDIEDTGVEGTDENGWHYHQLFPVNNTYDGSQYGFVCVPISTDWAAPVEGAEDCKGMGKHYTYNLDICGRNSGAGVYPPISSDVATKLIPTGAKVSALVLNEDKKAYTEQIVNLKVVTTRPDNKEVGDAVLDEPIKFNVTVSAWTKEDNKWTNGDNSNF